MLHEFIKKNRELLISRIASTSAQGNGYSDLQTAALGHIGAFLDQLTDALYVEHGISGDSAKSSPTTTGPAPAVQMSNTAYWHGRDLRDSNLTVGAVVRNYGSVCQAITGYAVDVNAPIDVAEFKTLNWCLDEAIAQAVTAFTTPAPVSIYSLKASQLKHDERLDNMAKMTHHIRIIANAVAAMRTGQVGLNGATGTLLDGSLNALQDLVEQGIDQRL